MTLHADCSVVLLYFSVVTRGGVYTLYLLRHLESSPPSKIFKCYVVAGVYYIVRPRMVVSVLNTYRLFSYHYPLTQGSPSPGP